MNPRQWQWLVEAANKIPTLFKSIEQGDNRAESLLGVRVIKGRHVKLSFVSEVVDTGCNPLANHSSGRYLEASERPNTQHRRRSRPKRW